MISVVENNKLDDSLEPQIREYNLLPQELLDINKVFEFGAKKYSPNGWLETNGKRTSFKEYHDSAKRHLLKSLRAELGFNRLDRESGLDHLLHCIVNCLMLYTRIKRKIENDKDMGLNRLACIVEDEED